MNQDLSNMLRELQIYNSPDNTFNPDYSTLMSVYEKFCDLINCDENLQLDNGPMSLFYRCKLMCRTAGIPDFQMMDIIDPDQKRMKTILAQLCKYCFWQKDISNKWERRNKEIIQLEDFDLIEAKKQKAELEDAIAIKQRDLDMKRKRFDQVKQMKAKIELELQTKRVVKQKILQSVNQTKNELLEADKKFYNLQEKLKVAQNELSILETMIVRDPKLLEQKVQDSKRRVEGMQKEVDKCQRESQLEEFKTDKIYQPLLMDFDLLARKLKLIQETHTELSELKKNHDKLNEQLINFTKSAQMEEAILNKLLIEKESLLQQKAHQEKQDSNTNQYSLQNLIEMQKQLYDIQVQVKQESQNYSKIQNQKLEYQKQLVEQEKIKNKIEENLKSVITQQLQEVSQYTQNIENLINNIDFE